MRRIHSQLGHEDGEGSKATAAQSLRKWAFWISVGLIVGLGTPLLEPFVVKDGMHATQTLKIAGDWTNFATKQEQPVCYLVVPSHSKPPQNAHLFRGGQAFELCAADPARFDRGHLMCSTTGEWVGQFEIAGSRKPLNRLEVTLIINGVREGVQLHRPDIEPIE